MVWRRVFFFAQICLKIGEFFLWDFSSFALLVRRYYSLIWSVRERPFFVWIIKKIIVIFCFWFSLEVVSGAENPEP